MPEKLGKSVIYIIHYFGFENKPLINYIEKQKTLRDNFIVIEDLAQACLSGRFGKIGDYSIHSLRKFLPVPDGGVLASRKRIPYRYEEPNDEFISKKIFSKLLRGFTNYYEVYLGLEKESEEIIDKNIVPRKISMFTKILLERIDILDIQKKRIKNWNKFNIKLKDLKVVIESYRFYELQYYQKPIPEGLN